MTVARCALVSLLLTGGLLHALEPGQSITQYAHTAWNRENRQLPSGVLSLAQTLDGALWIGTESGLLRFDGVRFQPWTPPNQQLATESITALAPARDGGLWIGTHTGLSHWKAGGIQSYPTSKGSAGPGVIAILVDRAGTVWAGTAGYRSGGLCRVAGDHLRCYSATDGLPGFGVYSLLEDRQGNLWAGGFGLGRWKPGTPRVYPSPDPREALHSIAEDRQGVVWAAGSGLRRLADGQLVPWGDAALNRNLQLMALLSDRDGGLWIGTSGQGLLRLYQDRIDRFSQKDGLSHDVVRCLLEDREGNLWAGTDGGLDRFREFAVTTISERDGLSHAAAGSLFAAKDGGVWIGTAAGLNRVEGRSILAYYKRDGLPSDNIIGIFGDQSGRLWPLTSAGLAYSDGVRFRPLQLPGARKVWFTAATEDRNHAVWLSDPEHGLIRLQNKGVAEVVPWSRFQNKRAWALEADLDDGGLWLGFAQGGVAYYKPGQAVRWYSSPGQAEHKAVMDLHRMRDGSLWMATQGGLGRLRNGQPATLAVAGGLPCDRILAMVEDDQGALWLNTGCGLVRISGADLLHWSAHPATRLPCRLFDASDGLRGGTFPTGYFRRAVKSNDGRLWFAVSDGVAVVNPGRLPENRLPPPVTIEGITAGHSAYSLRSGLRLPALTKELRIDYTAMSFVDPDKVRFRYRLEGFDKEWSDAAPRRQAVYTNLPPGSYTFRVIACNNDGVWNNSGTALAFSIAPAFYQRIWFRLLCLAAFGLVLLSLHRLRLRQVEAQLNMRFRERLAERTRIAREMHDTVLQNLCGFALQLGGLAKNTGIPASARACLYEIRREAELCLREAREFVWDLRSPTLEEKDLAEALREAGEQIVSGEPVQFHMTVKGKPRPAPARLQQQLLRIVQEATRNAVRYSQAKEIEMNIAYLEAGSIRVKMRDDGCGFDLEEASRAIGHWGLTTMRERAQQVGAELTISTAPGHGTEIEILAPMTVPEQ